jgi:hypothetical protein
MTKAPRLPYGILPSTHDDGEQVSCVIAYIPQKVQETHG